MDFQVCSNGTHRRSLLQNPAAPSPQLLKESLPASSSSLSPSSPLSPTASSRSSATSFEDLLVTSDPTEQLDSFLVDALNSRNRITVLRLELEIEKFVRNPDQQQLLLNPMPSSYERLAAHRVAQHYHVQSMAVDGTSPSGSRVLLVKTSESRIPSVKLVDIPIDSKPASPPHGKLAIKQRRKEGSFGSESIGSGRSTPLRSVEERMEEYNKARARIFSDEEITSRVNEPGQKVAEPIPYREPACGRTEIDQHEDDVQAKVANTVAVFRDREKDMKDPDYDRNRFIQPRKIVSLSPSTASGVRSSSSNGTSSVCQGGYVQLQKQACYSASNNQGCIWVGPTGLPVVGYPMILPNAVTPGFYSYSPNVYDCNQKLAYPRHYSSVDWRQGPIKVEPCLISSTDHSGWFQTY